MDRSRLNRTVSFPKTMRGYHVGQVDAYLASLCADFAEAEEDYQSRIAALEEKIAMLSQRLEEYQAVESEIESLRAELDRRGRKRRRCRQREAAVLCSENGTEDTKPEKCREHRARVTQQIFSVGADVIRLVGHAGVQAARILSLVRALPCPETGESAKESDLHAGKVRKKKNEGSGRKKRARSETEKSGHKT